MHYTPAPHSKTAKATQTAKIANSKQTQAKTTDSKTTDSQATLKPKPKPTESESLNTAPTILAVKSNLGLNLRAKPSTDSAILAKLPKYTQVKVLQQVGKWSKVLVDSIPQTKSTQTLQGYVISQALSNTLLPPQEQSQAQNTESAPQNTTKTPQNKEQDSIQNQSTTESYAKVIVNTAMVRAKPSTDSIIIAKAPKGRKMQILSFEKDKDNTQWAKIYYIFESQSGRREIQGYVAKRLLEPIP